MMAVTKIWAVKNRLRQLVEYVTNKDKTGEPPMGKMSDAVKDLLDYDENEHKTENRLFVSTVGCGPDNVLAVMKGALKLSDSQSDTVAYHMNRDYGDGANPVTLKSEFILSLCEQLIGNLEPKQKSIIDRCTAQVYRSYLMGGCNGQVPTLQDFHKTLTEQDEPEAKDVALAIELFTNGSLDTFAQPTNVNTESRFLCYDIHDLGKQLMPLGMLVVLDSILNRITANRAKGRKTYIYLDEIYLLFQHEYSANFLFTLWKRVRKYGAYITGITQNVEDMLQSHTARTMLANSELVIMLNQAATDREQLAELMGISDLQMSYITNAEAGHGLAKIGGALVPFINHIPANTKLYKLMNTKFNEVQV